MKRYKVRDTETGKRVIFRWNGDQPPTQDDMQMVFERARTMQPTTQPVAPQRPFMQRVAGAVAPYTKEALPIAGMMIGGGLAAPAGPVGAVGGAGLGYAAGNQLQDMLEQYGGLSQPKSVGQELIETPKDVLTGASMEATGGIAGKALEGALNYAGKVAPRLYESVAKIPPRSVDAFKRQKMINTAMEYGITPTKKGLSKLQGMIEGVNEKIGTIINDAASLSKRAKQLNQRSGVLEYDEDMIKIPDILKRLDSVKDWAKKSYADPSPIYKMIDEYKTGVKANRGSEIAVDEAQKLKQGIYRRLKDASYGEYSTPSKEIDKQFARGIKEELVKKYPQLQELNAKDSALISLENQLEKSVNRIRNRDVMGLADYGGTISGAELAGGPGAAIGAIAAKVLRSPAVLSNLSFALKKISQKAGAPILQRVIGYPLGKAAASGANVAGLIDTAMGATASPAHAMNPNDYTGNIDLNNRPIVKNADGTYSTVKSASFNIDGKEVLLPTIGPNGERWTNDQAVQNYFKTGKNLGIFDNVESANKAAIEIHNQQAKIYDKKSENMTMEQMATKAYLEGNYKRSLNLFKQAIRSNPKRSDQYKTAINQILQEIKGLKARKIDLGNGV